MIAASRKIKVGSWLLAMALLLAVLLGAGGRPAPIRFTDYDCDGQVGEADVLLVGAHWGDDSPLAVWLFDLDNDGRVRGSDFALLRERIGEPALTTGPWCNTPATSLAERSNRP